MIDVLFDDTKESIGSKLATADLIVPLPSDNWTKGYKK